MRLVYLKYVIEGWVNWFLDLVSDIKYKSVFDERYRICSECEHNNIGICDICHCILKAKTKSEGSECPINKWGAVTGDK